MNKLQLLDQKGFPIIKSSVNTVYQTDWQGRVALSNMPRTNYCQWGSQPWNGIGSNANVTCTDSGIASASGDHFCLIAFSAPASPSIATFIHQAGTWYAEFSLRAPSTSESACNWLLYDNANVWEFGSQAQILYGPGALADRNNISGLSTTQDTRVRVWGTTPAGSNTPAVTFYCYAQNRSGAILIADISIGFLSDVGVYIPTTYAPVTVTDYADNGDGTVALGQDTPDTSTFQWSGTGISKGETELSPYNVSVSQQIINPVVGSNNVLQLVDSIGFPLSTANIQSIYKTDWQGRVALSSTPRTNSALNSDTASAWAPLLVTLAASGTTPSGATATSMVPTTANNQHYVTTPTLNAGLVSLACSAKASGYNYLIVQFADGVGYPQAIIDLQNGTVVSASPGLTVTLVGLVSGWWQIYATLTDSSAGHWVLLATQTSAGGQIFAGDGVSGYLIGSLDCVSGVAPPFVHIVTGASPVTLTDYADNGDGTVALGQYAANTDVYDWSGTGVGWR